MNGAWITYNGDIIYTSDNLNHELSLNISGAFTHINSNLQFSNDEINKNLNKDIRYMAFKSGLVRIVCAYNQFAVECIIKTLTNKSINAICQYLIEQRKINNIEMYLVEDATTNKSYFFNSVVQFLAFLNAQ